MTTMYGSLTRIADLEGAEFQRLPRSAWATGDYVVGRVIDRGPPERRVELPNGRMAMTDLGDRIVGALGVRAATLEVTGSWERVGEDGELDLLTSAGLMGKIASISPFIGGPVRMAYEGHLVRDGSKLTMSGAASHAVDRPFHTPVVLIVGTSMSAGKSASARAIVRILKAMGKRVVAAKLTGAGRFRDVQSMGDAGADAIFDFVDAGLPSTVCSEQTYRDAIPPVLSRMASVEADVAVIEAGASPLEPYNGEACMDLIGPNIRWTVLCASDPYAVIGVAQAFEREPDVVGGIATNTDAARALVSKLTGLPAVSFIDPAQSAWIEAQLRARFG